MKICIVGGGSAGWMTATTLVRLLEDDITLVESPSINTIGVGESTLGHIRDWIDLVGIRDSENDFIRETGASLKHSIKFTNWLKKDSGSFHYPFGEKPLIDPAMWWRCRNTTPDEISCNTYGQEVNPIGLLAERGKVNREVNYAYHFDATKFGEFLRERYCQDVNHIFANVIGYNGDSISLDDGQEIEADLFIDCTGFRSLLLGGFLKEPFISYDDLLPNDSAWATHIPYTDKERQLVAYTECTAINNGWVWNIPLWDNRGTGYVYSSKHISHKDAKQEFIDYLGTSDGEFRHISMKIGRYKRTWVKNVVAIGLSAGFIEPLESNGLLTVHENLKSLYTVLRRGKPSQLMKDYYNFGTAGALDTFAQFVAIHYGLTQREDTQYWRDIFNKQYDMEMKPPVYGIPAFASDLFIGRTSEYDKRGTHYIESGMNLSPIIHNVGNSINCLSQRKQFNEEWEEKVNNLPTLYEYLKKTIYFKT